MSQKGKRGKPTRKEIENSIKQIFQTINLIGQKMEYIEEFAKSTELALDLYVQFNKDKDKFLEYIQEFQKKEKEKAEKEEKELGKKEEQS